MNNVITEPVVIPTASVVRAVALPPAVTIDDTVVIGNIPATPLLLTIATGVNGYFFRIIFDPDYIYNALIEWGDGQSSQIVSPGVSQIIHAYENGVPREYQISISGVLPAFNCSYQFNLIRVDSWGTHRYRTMSQALNFCSALVSIPAGGDFSYATNFEYAWAECSALIEFPLMNLSRGTNFYSAWSGCSSMTTFNTLDLSSGTDFQGAWGGCGFTEAPLVDVSSVLDFGGAFANNLNLVHIPAINLTTATAITAIASGSVQLESIDCVGISTQLELPEAQLSANALNSIFTNLLVVPPSTGLFIAPNPGRATCDITIAENKGWYVYFIPIT